MPKALWLPILKKSFALGMNTLAAEVTHVSRHGFWLRLDEESILLPFAEFSWFRQATIEQLMAVEWPSRDHLYWPLLDVDLSVASIRNSEKISSRLDPMSTRPALSS
jgi:hypothetical protein